MLPKAIEKDDFLLQNSVFVRFRHHNFSPLLTIKKQSTKGNFDISKIVFYPNQLVAKVVLVLFSRYFSERFEQE
jgi:hypothetical protein